MKAKRTRKADITVTNILPGYVDTDIITGPTFWMAPVDKAVKQMYTAIRKKKRRAYITRRWRLVALVMQIVPPGILIKFL
jgi:short-subunit dehydrogenase